jgi:tetratricopeptide (TPR) repeat protein
MPSFKYSSLAMLLLLAATVPAAAQTTREQADDAFAASAWTDAARLYREVLAQDGDDPNVWYLLGTTRLRLADHAAAMTALGKALEFGYPEVPVRFAIAKVAAAAGDPNGAFVHLEALADLGSSRQVVQRLESEAEFDGMRGDPRFAEILFNLTPCNGPAYREFDFWIGDWDVQNPQGQVVGHNTISALLDGCLLFENWTGLGGSKGISINYFDFRTAKWTQTYRDNTGNIGTWPNLIGALVQGAMTLETAPGETPMSRWVWTRVDDNKVRQMAEVSTDDGETWAVVWDSYYIRQQ